MREPIFQHAPGNTPIQRINTGCIHFYPDFVRCWLWNRTLCNMREFAELIYNDSFHIVHP